MNPIEIDDDDVIVISDDDDDGIVLSDDEVNRRLFALGRIDESLGWDLEFSDDDASFADSGYGSLDDDE
jgi:hypothetical protein